MLELALPLLEEAAGAPVEGKIGDPNPVDAINDAVNIDGYDEIIISTLPARVSRWMHLNLPSKLTPLGLPITTVTAKSPRTAARDRGPATGPAAPTPSASRSACSVDQNASSSHGSSAGANARTSDASRGLVRDAERACREDDQHRARVGARVDADEAAELDLHLELLARLAHGGVLDGLAELDVAARERPAPRALVQRAAQQPDPALVVARDRRGDRLGAPQRVVAAGVAAQLARERDLRGLRAARADGGNEGSRLGALDERLPSIE